MANLDEEGLYDMICLGFKNLSKFEDRIMLTILKMGFMKNCFLIQNLKILCKQKKKLKK